ncbi:conserved hypothetical protein [Ricinus communis]|uniref:Uncharacterized protein n=1 Tax=Ricinus communis TaxID=3988 RepID=B9RQ13_RICCO|nr:conserved hypothetical protein [Ricinus communis]
MKKLLLVWRLPFPSILPMVTLLAVLIGAMVVVLLLEQLRMTKLLQHEVETMALSESGRQQ